MASIKSVFDGIGTGSGVSWPTFGILFPALGLAIGGTTALIIGSTLGVIFAGVAIPVVYLSYTQSKKEDAALQTKLNKNHHLLTENILNYLNTIYEQFETSADELSCRQFMVSKINKDREKHRYTEGALLRFLDLILSDDDKLLKCFIASKYSLQKPADLKNAIHLSIHILEKSHRQLTPKSSLVIAGFVAFASTFGAVAGCSTGLLGLLAGVGLFPGLAAVPVLGWAVLAAAFILAVYVAVKMTQKAHERFQLKSRSTHYKELSENVDDLSLERGAKYRTQAINRSKSQENSTDNASDLEKSPTGLQQQDEPVFAQGEDFSLESASLQQ